MNYIFNKETLKIELHFEKSEYNSLSDEQKSKLKSNFLWSNAGKCWVSRAKEPHLCWAIETAKQLGFEKQEVKGEYLSYAEQIERQKERAEARAERYEEHADNAARRGENMQKGINDMHGDIAFFTQPNVASASGRAFTNRREKLFARYEKGFEEYRKSDYFLERAQTALETAAMEKFNDKGYLMRKITECVKEVKQYESRIVNLEDKLYRIENGEVLINIHGTTITAESLKESLQIQIEYVERLMDKQAFFENKLDELGGVTFSKENIKVGFIVRLSRRSGGGIVEVVSVGPKNIKYKTKYTPFPLTASFAEIEEVIKEVTYA